MGGLGRGVFRLVGYNWASKQIFQYFVFTFGDKTKHLVAVLRRTINVTPMAEMLSNSYKKHSAA